MSSAEDRFLERCIGCVRSVLPPRLRTHPIGSSTRLEELGVDSIAFIEIIVALETEFGVALTEDLSRARRVSVVGDVASWVREVAAMLPDAVPAAVHDRAPEADA